MQADLIWRSLGAAAFSYLLGALPFSLWIARWRRVDILHAGSGNPGATNVARSVGKGWGALALALDLAKGVAAAALTGALGAPLTLSGMAVVGHNWSVFLRFSGGKGVATTLGLMLVLSWQAMLLTVTVLLLLVAATRKVSVGSLVALLISPVFVWFFARDWMLVALFAALALLSLVRHRENLRRLLQGRELSVAGNNERKP